MSLTLFLFVLIDGDVEKTSAKNDVASKTVAYVNVQ
jgi:hypothetical protein